MPIKDIEKRRKYQREYMRRKRKDGTYETPYAKWKREQLAKNPSADVSFAEFLRHIEMEKLIKKRYAEANKFWGKPREQHREAIKGINLWHGEPEPQKCSRCGLPMESDEGLNDNVCDECKINALIG